MRAVVLAVVVTLGLAGPVRGDVPPPDLARSEGRRLYDDGRRHYDLREYEDALASFKKAYLVSDEPALLHNVALCLEQLGRYAEAAEFYRAFLKRGPQLAPRERSEVEALIRSLEQRPRDLRLGDAQPAPQIRPLYRRWWLWTAVGGGVAVAVGLGVGLGLGLRQGYSPTVADPVSLR